jgi:uncharacterized protein
MHRSSFPASLVIFLLVAFLTAGCRKRPAERLRPSEIHRISRELSEAARAAAPGVTQIQIRLEASEKNREATDGLDITLRNGDSPSSAQSQAARIHQALGNVARRHRLTEEACESREGMLVCYSRGGARTHTVRILVAPEPSANRSVQSHDAKLAIILDDLGSDRHAAEEIFDLPYPLTISVLPNHEHSAEIAREAQHRGYEVLLHLPMQARSGEKSEAQELRPGMPAAAVAKLVNQLLETVPGAVGVNNHQGSEATRDPDLMRELMPVLRDHQLFYIDSRTTAATVAYQTAQSSRVPSAFRSVPFLDDVEELDAVCKQLELALRGAREKGEAVAIGHPHPATLQALREVLPKLPSEGVRLAFVSELVH